jgi:hypothetical protein
MLSEDENDHKVFIIQKLAAAVETIWNDGILMKVVHILLGRPWTNDRRVQHDGKANTYIFSYNGKKNHLAAYEE